MTEIRTFTIATHIPELAPPLEPGEQERRGVWADGVHVGDIVYVAHRHRAPAGSQSSTGHVTEYGWRPLDQPDAPLMTSRDAAHTVAGVTR